MMLKNESKTIQEIEENIFYYKDGEKDLNGSFLMNLLREK